MRQAGYLVLALALCSPQVRAEPLKDIPPGDDRIEILKERQPAPYEGLLYDKDTAVRWSNWLRQYKVRLKEDVDLERTKGVLALEAAERMHTAQTQILTSELEKQRVRADTLQRELEAPPWYRTVWFGAATGALITGGFAIAVGLLYR